MIRVRLTVLLSSAAMEWDFISLPRAGDHIDIERDGRPEKVTVRRVVHFAAQHPLPRSETPYQQRKEPFIRILAVRADGRSAPDR
jgi:hypothetical protein